MTTTTSTGLNKTKKHQYNYAGKIILEPTSSLPNSHCFQRQGRGRREEREKNRDRDRGRMRETEIERDKETRRKNAN